MNARMVVQNVMLVACAKTSQDRTSVSKDQLKLKKSRARSKVIFEMQKEFV